MKKVALLLCYCVACLILGCSHQDPLKAARRIIAEREYEKGDKALSQIKCPDAQWPYSQVQEYYTLQAMIYAWKEEWAKAAEQANRLTDLNPAKITQIPINPQLQSELNQSKLNKDDFTDIRFTEEDMRFLNRTLWIDYLAHRITQNTEDPFVKTVQVLDYVYRHIRFGISNEFLSKNTVSFPPFATLCRGEGMCDEISWVINALLQRLEIPTLRLVLWKNDQPGVSPHTLSLAKINQNWVGIDGSFGILLKSSITQKPEIFPANFLINPTAQDFTKFGNKKKTAMEYEQEIRKYGPYKDFSAYFDTVHAVYDNQWENYTPRFQFLNAIIHRTTDHAALIMPYKIVYYPMSNPENGIINQWAVCSLPMVFNLTHDKNPLRRAIIQESYPYYEPLKEGIRAEFRGDGEKARDIFQAKKAGSGSDQVSMEYIDYNLAILAYEEGNLEEAKSNYLQFLRRYPGSLWANRIYYQLARIYHSEGNTASSQELLKKCQQDNEGSLFAWITKLDLPIKTIE